MRRFGCRTIAHALTGVRFASAAHSIAFSPDGELLAAAWREDPTQICDARTGELSARPGTANWVWSVAFSPDGSLVATGDWNGMAQLWSTDTRNRWDAHSKVRRDPDPGLLAR